MPIWVWPPIAFAAILSCTALARRRIVLAAGFVAYALLTAALARIEASAVRFAAPLLALVAGYWLTGPFYTSPSDRLEAWLMRLDRRLDIDRRAAAAPRWFRALLELAYAGCYPFMVVAAIPAFRHSTGAFAWHWTLVLSAELACYVTLPWLQARPPREIRDSPQFFDSRKKRDSPWFLQFNHWVLSHLSVRATTIPSGHVAGPIAASLSAWMIAPEYGPWLFAGAIVITAATVAGRYHYAIDAVMGLVIGAVPQAVRSFWI